jgi:hypothetical protein
MKKKKTDDLIIDINTLLEIQKGVDIEYKKALKLLRKKLPDGWAKEISATTGKSMILVYKVLSGEKKDTDDSILLTAIEMAEQNVENTTSKKISTINKIKNL